MHGNVMQQETVDLLAETRTLLIPTLLLLHNWAEHGHLIGSPRHIADACKRMLERTHASLHLAREAGVLFGVGTDTGFSMTPYGEWHAKELELLMEYAGLSAVEAIAAGTYNNGRVLNLEGEVGGVAPGMLADLLVVDGDPSADITILQDKTRFAHIILDGEFVEVDLELESWAYDRALTQADRNLTVDLLAQARDNGNSRQQVVVPNLPNPIAE
jgi:imidazolonepropionase-like amidohydrolase